MRSEVVDRISQFDNSISVQNDIQTETNLDYNSILLVIGKTGSGKRFNIGNELATLKYLDHDFVQILYVINNPNDLTLMKLKDLIEVPIRFISYEESRDCIQELRQYTQAYDEIIEKGLIEQITDDCKQDILQFFHLRDFVQKPFYNIIIYDDAMNIFKKPTSPEWPFRPRAHRRVNRPGLNLDGTSELWAIQSKDLTFLFLHKDMFSIEDSNTDAVINLSLTSFSEVGYTHEITDVNNLETRLDVIEQSIESLPTYSVVDHIHEITDANNLDAKLTNYS